MPNILPLQSEKMALEEEATALVQFSSRLQAQSEELANAGAELEALRVRKVYGEDTSHQHDGGMKGMEAKDGWGQERRIRQGEWLERGKRGLRHGKRGEAKNKGHRQSGGSRGMRGMRALPRMSLALNCVGGDTSRE